MVVEVAVQEFVDGLYFPPVFKFPVSYPPHTIITLLSAAQTAEKYHLDEGTLVVEVVVQELVDGLYFPPVICPAPHIIISFPVHTAE